MARTAFVEEPYQVMEAGPGREEMPVLSVVFTCGYGRDFCGLPNVRQIPHRFVKKPLSATNLVRQTRLALAERLP